MEIVKREKMGNGVIDEKQRKRERDREEMVGRER